MAGVGETFRGLRRERREILRGFGELQATLLPEGRVVQHSAEWWMEFRQEWERLEEEEERLSRAIHHWQQQQ